MISSAVLLAAGRGSRLQPYTDTVPKPLLVHRGKPTLDYLTDSLLAAGITNIVLVVNHLSEQLEQYAAARSAYSSQKLSCVVQPHLFGTAHALQTVVDEWPDFFQGSFVLSATDYLVPKSFFPDLIGYHNTASADVTVSLKQLPESELSSRSSVRFNEDGSIAEIVEKPLPGEAPSSIGANLSFVLPATILGFLEDVPMSSRGEREIQYAINQLLNEGGKAVGLMQGVPDEWRPQ